MILIHSCAPAARGLEGGALRRVLWYFSSGLVVLVLECSLPIPPMVSRVATYVLPCGRVGLVLTPGPATVAAGFPGNLAGNHQPVGIMGSYVRTSFIGDSCPIPAARAGLTTRSSAWRSYHRGILAQWPHFGISSLNGWTLCLAHLQSYSYAHLYACDHSEARPHP